MTDTPRVEARRPRLAPGLVLGLVLIPSGVAVGSGASLVTALVGGDPVRWIAVGLALVALGALFRTGALQASLYEQQRRIDGLERYIAAGMPLADWHGAGVLPPSDRLHEAVARAAAAGQGVVLPTGTLPPGGAQHPRRRR